MKLNRITLCNFRGVREMMLPISDRVTVLVGINGAGKSTLLDAIAILLSWFTSRIGRTAGKGNNWTDLDINNESDKGHISIDVNDGKVDYSWFLMRYRKGTPVALKSQLDGSAKLAGAIQERFATAGNGSLPVVVYYPVHRAVLEIPLKIRKDQNFSPFDAYDESLIAGASFRKFFEWFRSREDFENEHYRENSTYVDPQLSAVRTAISHFTDFSDLRIRRSPLRMELSKGSLTLDVRQLSDGEKCLLALVGDLARRLAIANPSIDQCLKQEGIVLIDEIDLHLHPGWQRTVLAKLQDVFPRCQFIVSTHSAQVIGEARGEDVRRLSVDSEKGTTFFIPSQSKGLDSSEILEDLMGTSSRNEDVSNALNRIFVLIEEEKFDDARDRIDKLVEEVNGDIPELVRARALIAMLDDRSAHR